MTESRAHLEFHKAMSDLESMFPDLESQVIEVVLRSNNGAVGSTVDHLLSISTLQQDHDSKEAAAKKSERNLIDLGEDESAHCPPLLDLSDTTDVFPDKKYSDEPKIFPSSIKLSYSHPCREDEDASDEKTEGASGCCSSSIIPTQKMLQSKYEENLKKREEAKLEDDKNSLRYFEDERVALLLQNEEFMSELRKNRDFISVLELESHQTDVIKSDMPNITVYHPQSKSQNSAIDEALFQERVKNMGKTSKKKFSQLATMFSKRKSEAKQLLTQSTKTTKGKFSMNSAEPLVNRESDEEEEEDNSRIKNFLSPKHKGKYSNF